MTVFVIAMGPPPKSAAHGSQVTFSKYEV